jgi:hypothetical protein
MPRGLRQVALSISCLSPIIRDPDALDATKIASLIFRPERLLMVLTSLQSLRRPSLSFGSSSFISLRRQSLSLSRASLRPPGNIQRPSRFRLTRSTRPRFAATSFEDFAIPESALCLVTYSLSPPRLETKVAKVAGVRQMFTTGDVTEARAFQFSR